MRRVILEEAAQIISRAPREYTRADLIMLLRRAKDEKPESMELYAEALTGIRREFTEKGWIQT